MTRDNYGRYRARRTPYSEWQGTARCARDPRTSPTWNQGDPVSATSEAAAAGQASRTANPLGTDGFEFVEYTAPDTRPPRAALRAHGVQPHCASPLQGRGPLPARGHQLHRECRAQQPRAALRARARAERLCHGLSRQGCGARLARCRGGGRQGGSRAPWDRWSSTSRRSRAWAAASFIWWIARLARPFTTSIS